MTQPLLWHITFNTTKDVIYHLGAFSETIDASFSWQEDEGQTEYKVDVILSSEKDKQETLRTFEEQFYSFFNQLETPQNLFLQMFHIRELENKDWLAENQASFKPLRIGSFYIHSSHAKEESPLGTMPIQIDAATAFGSGEHPTTQGCLLAFDYIKERLPVVSALDMGCGSGILAIAIAKAWPLAAVDACDFDKHATSTTQENAHMNGVETQLTVFFSDGYQNIPPLKTYDLIAANILASPLCVMAPHLAAHLKEGGFAVLSGLLDRQAREVLDAHVSYGMICTETFSIGGWATLILQKDGHR